MTQSNAVQVDPKAAYLHVDEAITDQLRVIDNLQTLVNQLTGRDSPPIDSKGCESTNVTPDIALVPFLADADARVRDNTNQLMDLVEELRHQLLS